MTTAVRRRATRPGGGLGPVVRAYRLGGAWTHSRSRHTGAGPAAPPSQLVSTRFGASVPQYGLTGATGTEADVVSKFGTKAMIRRFNGVPSSTPPTKTSGASGNHVSWSFGIKVEGKYNVVGQEANKTAVINSNNAMADAILAGTYDNQIKASAAGLDPAYFYVEVLHELDTKTNLWSGDGRGFMDLAKGQAVKTRAYNLIKSANSDLLVVATYQAYGLASSNSVYTSGVFEQRYGAIPHDVLGIDADGIAPPYDDVKNADGTTTRVYKLPYPSLVTRAENAQKWVTAHGLKGWSVPEWGTLANAVAADADNQILADSWITYWANNWLGQPIPPLYACWYDYGPNPEAAASTLSDLLQQPASIGALSDLVGGAVATVAP